MARSQTVPVAITAAIYARYSSSGQNDASIEQQIEECKTYAAHNNLTVVSEYEDRAMTGRNDRRPGFQRMIRAAERHEFQVLLKKHAPPSKAVIAFIGIYIALLIFSLFYL